MIGNHVSIRPHCRAVLRVSVSNQLCESYDVKCQVCGVEDARDSDAENGGEEGIQGKAVKNVHLPSQLEIDEHNANHLPFRDWCPFYVQGKGVSSAHRKRKQEATGVPVISMDYMVLSKRESRRQERIQSL